MTVATLTIEMSSLMALPESDLIRKGLLALAEKEIRLAEEEIARIRERYDVFSKEALYGASGTAVFRVILPGKTTSFGRTKKRTFPSFVTLRNEVSACSPATRRSPPWLCGSSRTW